MPPLLLTIICVCTVTAHGHEKLDELETHSNDLADGDAEKREANHSFQLLTSLVETWPLPCREGMIFQAALEHQFIHDDPRKKDLNALRSSRRDTLATMTSLIPTYQVAVRENGLKLLDLPKTHSVCKAIPTLVLIRCINQTDSSHSLRIASNTGKKPTSDSVVVPPKTETLLSHTLHVDPQNQTNDDVRLHIQTDRERNEQPLSIPIQIVEPATLRLRFVGNTPAEIAGRITVQCSDGICRHGGHYANKSTFTDKPIIYPPIDTWQKLPFFYADGLVEMKVPPGDTRVTFEKGFEHRREIVDVTTKPDETLSIERECKRIIDMFARGWVSGDTHVHWVTNAWNIDEPLELLAMAQRAEDLRVANNLTLLQRYANQAFVKPSQAPMGPILEMSDSRFHMQMGEEYRNEDLYGHLCFLNIDWLVQPIGTGSIIAGPDSLDYPINRTAIEACRVQGGISIEAHGTGGNKDVPVNVIHRLTDSLDQMEPSMYYRLLDCGFRLPLTNGSDHPARTLGIARSYVELDGAFTYDRWIDGIRKGRTFTTSGPLIFLEVNGAGLGEVLRCEPQQALRIKAKVLSRDPIGAIEIISNGKTLFSAHTHDTQFDVDITVPTIESRWIVARCSHRTDGRSEFGFGNFNAITGPGIAHTSPIYVQVDGMPRFDPMAAQYWQGRMRDHANQIRVKGRFATEAHRKEAVGYIEQGIEMFEALKQQAPLARSKSETFDQAKRRLVNVIRRFGPERDVSPTLRRIENTVSFEQLRDAVDALTLFTATISPETGLELEPKVQTIELRQDIPTRFLVEIANHSALIGLLHLEASDTELGASGRTEGLDVEVIDSPFVSAFLTGTTHEYKVVELRATDGDKREIDFVANIADRTAKRSLTAKTHQMIHVRPRNRRPMAGVSE
ncbi:MAG: CehA/McbA family metallohydrolase [Planctomycetota bacterium]